MWGDIVPPSDVGWFISSGVMILMILLFDPRPEFAVELVEVLDFFMLELSEEVSSQGSKKSFDFSAPFWRVRSGGNFPDTEFSADDVDLMCTEDLSVIDIEDFRDATF